MADFALAEVFLWGAQVGAVVESDTGEVVFEYADAFRASGLEISPIHLPLARAGPQRFDRLRDSNAFAGLPGVLADALPDRFGNAVIRAFFAARGAPERALSPVQRLLYIGARAMGALEFRPALRVTPRASEELPLEVAELVAQSRQIVEGRSDIALPEIMSVGASAGGMRPKALVLWNRTTDELRSGHVAPRAHEEHWLIKFDGVAPVGEGEARGGIGAPQPFMRMEYAYAQLARAAGIVMPETRLLFDRGYAHFMARRFDRTATGERVHQHTLGGMLHVDYNTPAASSYEEFLRTILTLGLGHDALEQAFRRLTFNIAAVNQDDHVKNISFLMDGTGRWFLSPAYDIVFAHGAGYTRAHQMSLRGKVSGITRDDLIALGEEFGLRTKARRIVGEVAEALRAWEPFAAESSVPPEFIAHVRAELDARGIAEGP